MRWTGIILRIIVGLSFVGSGAFTVADPGEMARELNLQSWFMVLTGSLKLIGGLGLLASFRVPRLALPSGLLLVAIMTGALIVHFRLDDPLSNYVSPAVLLILSGIVSAIALWQDLDLRNGLANRIAVTLEDTERRHRNA